LTTSYIGAANYAVGVYTAGAGYSLQQTLDIAETYAFYDSSNYNSQNQKDWTTAGWNDATAGRWK
jgi:trimethylamine:corrinoid methyltransferase-like protein